MYVSGMYVSGDVPCPHVLMVRGTGVSAWGGHRFGGFRCQRPSEDEWRFNVWSHPHRSVSGSIASLDVGLARWITSILSILTSKFAKDLYYRGTICLFASANVVGVWRMYGARFLGLLQPMQPPPRKVPAPAKSSPHFSCNPQCPTLESGLPRAPTRLAFRISARNGQPSAKCPPCSCSGWRRSQPLHRLRSTSERGLVPHRRRLEQRRASGVLSASIW